MTIADELAAAQAAAAVDALPDLAVVSRYAQVREVGAGHTESWTPDIMRMRVRIGSLVKPTQPVDIQRLESITDAMHISYPANATLNVKDRLTVRSVTYEISVLLGDNSWALLNEAYAFTVT